MVETPTPPPPPPAPVIAPAPAPPPSAWDTALPDEHRALVRAKGWKGPGDAVRDFHSLEKTVGNRVALPAADAKDEDFAKFFDPLGRPKTAADYDLKEFKPPEGLPWSDDFMAGMREEMHAAGVPQRMAKRLVDGYAKRAKAQYDADAAKVTNFGKEQHTNLVRKLGQPEYDRRKDLVGRVLGASAGELMPQLRTLRTVDGTFVLDNPVILESVFELVKHFGEDGNLPRHLDAGAITPENAAHEKARLMADPETAKAFMDRGHKDHKKITEQLARLDEAIVAGKR